MPTDPVTMVAHSDGGARGNPGEAACAAILYDTDGGELLRRARRLGKTTNNVAEYEGVILALELAAQLGARRLEIRVDSELVARQLEGRYKVKNANLKTYHTRAKVLIEPFERVRILAIPREKNREADKLVNAALDGKDV
jgi:ribonuclease HI